MPTDQASRAEPWSEPSGLEAPIEDRRSWLAAATDRAILGRSVVTCLFVGALLTAINHGDQLLRREFDLTLAWQVGLTFVVPFLVATTSAAAALRSRSGFARSSPDFSAEPSDDGVEAELGGEPPR